MASNRIEGSGEPILVSCKRKNEKKQMQKAKQFSTKITHLDMQGCHTGILRKLQKNNGFKRKQTH